MVYFMIEIMMCTYTTTLLFIQDLDHLIQEVFQRGHLFWIHATSTFRT